MDCINVINGPEILGKNLEISTICFIKDCSLIAVGTDKGRMFFWDMNRSVYLNNTYERIFKHKMSITSIKEVQESSKNNKLLFSSSEDGLIIVWEIECIELKEQTIRKPEEKLHVKEINIKHKKLQELLPKIETKSDLHLIYSHRYVPQIKSIINTNTILKEYLASDDNIQNININSSFYQINVISYTNIYPNYIFSGGNDNSVNIWDFQKSQLINKLQGHKSSIVCLTFDKYYLFSGSKDNQIFIWNLHDYTLITTLGKSNFNVRIYDIMMIQKFGVLVSISSDKKINFWKYQSKELIKTVNSKQECICLNIVESYGKMIFGTKEKIIWEFDLIEIIGESNIQSHYKQLMENNDSSKDGDINNFKIVKCLI